MKKWNIVKSLTKVLFNSIICLIEKMVVKNLLCSSFAYSALIQIASGLMILPGYLKRNRWSKGQTCNLLVEW